MRRESWPSLLSLCVTAMVAVLVFSAPSLAAGVGSIDNIFMSESSTPAFEGCTTAPADSPYMRPGGYCSYTMNLASTTPGRETKTGPMFAGGDYTIDDNGDGIIDRVVPAVTVLYGRPYSP